MFSDEVLVEIFNHERVRDVPLLYQTIMVHAIEEVLDDVKENANDRRTDDTIRNRENGTGV